MRIYAKDIIAQRAPTKKLRRLSIVVEGEIFTSDPESIYTIAHFSVPNDPSNYKQGPVLSSTEVRRLGLQKAGEKALSLLKEQLINSKEVDVSNFDKLASIAFEQYINKYVVNLKIRRIDILFNVAPDTKDPGSARAIISMSKPPYVKEGPAVNSQEVEELGKQRAGEKALSLLKEKLENSAHAFDMQNFDKLSERALERFITTDGLG